MQIITLTSDMGLTDHYVASLKGTIFSRTSAVQIVDISHDVQPFDVSQEAYYLNNCFRDFPLGTIHVCCVDSEPIINFGSSQDSAVPAIMLFEGHYFVSNDNGFFGLLLNNAKPEQFWKIDDVLSNPSLYRFPTKNILIPAACKIANGEDVSTFASEAEEFKRAFNITAVIGDNLIKGNVIHIDHYGNVITNVTRELFDRFGENIPFTIYFRRKEYYIDEISPTYNAVVPGEKVAIFNSNGFLEIALNRGAKTTNGGASTLFGLTINDIVRIEFSPRGSKETLDSLF
ncbi:MAG: SAM-dependent chlorinase/fluorinase [Crocinitomicaceae bacterium]|nr:SAM-dependent chlorinase/fluorinase [Crocinitomicaceae bacterium]